MTKPNLKTLLLGASLAAASALAASAASAQSVNIALDGYCNTFALTLDGFEIYGTRAGCGYTVIDGGSVAKIGSAKYDITSDTSDGASNIFVWYFTPAKHKVGNWYLYSSTGSAFTEVNSGTYTETVAGAARREGADVTTSPKRAVRGLPVF